MLKVEFVTMDKLYFDEMMMVMMMMIWIINNSYNDYYHTGILLIKTVIKL